MNKEDRLSYKVQWYLHLQAAVKQVVQEAYQGRWKYSLIGDKGLAMDIVEQEGVFEILEVVYDENKEELVLYARVGEEMKDVNEVREVIYRVMSCSGENYLVLVPFYFSDTLQFWFMTGYESHGHTGRIIIRQEDNPHIQFDSI